MAPSSSSSATATSVQVALRIRPPTSQDSTNIPARFQRSVVHATSPNTVAVELTPAAISGPGASAAISSVSAVPKKQLFSFDQVHPPPTKQYDLFTSTAKPLVSRFLEGFNCTVLAYGQTSSGKTYTMTGVDLDADPTDPRNGMGIIPRSVSNIFSSAKQLKDQRAGAWSYTVKASFIEIYNEDLIDLLSMDDAGGRREVQIREDKDGHIIWGGLREMNVRTSAEVMSLIRKGTAIRRTNETDMNAQSSRSHAIFSLTLTQKKYKGTGPPPRSSSPLPPNGRSPSRLARPGSMVNNSSTSGRVASPTFGRPGTPSFTAAMNRGGLRPSSALGHTHERANSGVNGAAHGDEEGEWVTIVSKFHFVDLAGSERLKRTAAAGERIKEGISINSGLLALGNVISALGDPGRSKSHTASHVPYRDSKLTRLLQDSLGGNAHTLMIACVSPAEYNANETINTLKYANRARNIKNHAVLNEKEDGWDDIEWLQATVTRLRKEVKSLKEGDGSTGGTNSIVRQEESMLSSTQSKKTLAQMAELRNNYEDLRAKFVERTEELTRLRRELGDVHRGNMGGAIGGTARYEEIVGPVIEEYEKTIAAMEAELGLNKAALRHTNEMYDEKEEELALVTERHTATELYVEELRTRVAKLAEREASTEAYIRDLEEKIKSYDETAMSSRNSMTDLKREVTRFKDAESHSGKYIAELEARLGRSDESIVSLQQTVEKLEAECERRRDEVKKLESSLQELKQDSEGWRSDLERREKHVKELEQRLAHWEEKKRDANETRMRLGSVVGRVRDARKSLELDLAGSSTAANEASPKASSVALAAEIAAEQPDQTASIESQFLTLQQTHTATLADLSTITAKYRDALHEISDLAAQIQEARLSNVGIGDSVIVDSATPEKSVDLPSRRRKLTSSRSRDSAEDSQSRHNPYRQAVSTESLRTRSLSQSLSQELTTAHLRATSVSSQGSSPSRSSHQRYLSNSSVHATMSHFPLPSPHERSVQSLEKEIMRLQEVLREREAEITVLEASLRVGQEEMAASAFEEEIVSPVVNGTSQQQPSPRKLVETRRGGNETASEISGSPSEESLERLNELMLSMAQKESNHKEVVDNLNSQLSQVQRQLDDLTAVSRDQALNMSTEMEGMRRRHAEDLALLDQVRTKGVELRETLRTSEVQHAQEMDAMRIRYEEALAVKSQEVDELVANLKEEYESSIVEIRNQLSAESLALEKAHRSHEERFGIMKAEHEIEVKRQAQAAKDVLDELCLEHAKVLAKVQDEHVEVLKQREAESNAVLQRTEEEYYNALTKIRGDHAETLKKHTSELNAALERLREEHASEMRMAEIAREGSLSETQSAQTAALKDLQDAHAADISRREASFAKELESLRVEHERTLKMCEDDHSLQVDRLRLEHESTTAKLKEDSRVEVDRLLNEIKDAKEEILNKATKAQRELETAVQMAEEHEAKTLHEYRRKHEDELLDLEATHEKKLQEATAHAEDKIARMLQSHREEIIKIKTRNEEEIAKLNAVRISQQEEHDRDIKSAREQQDHLTKEKESLADMLAALQDEHGQSLTAIHQRYDQVLDDSSRLATELTTLQDNYRRDLAVIEDQNRLLVEEKIGFAKKLDDLSSQRSQGLENVLAELNATKQEVGAQKAAADQMKEQHMQALEEKGNAIDDLQRRLIDIGGERNDLEAEVMRLRGELNEVRNAQSKRQSTADELERQRTTMAELQETLQRVRDEKDAMQLEKTRADVLVRDLQSQVSRGASPTARTVTERNSSFTNRPGLPSIKLPPPTPPPSVPPPPAPGVAGRSNSDATGSVSSHSSSGTGHSSTSRDCPPDSPATSISTIPTVAVANAVVDPKIGMKLEEQSKQIEEQEAMIKTLNKQLTHCESDLQTHMDLVATLEASLADSEKNLRKFRIQSTELARERDTLTAKVQSLQAELADAKREVVSVRRSIVEEKQSLEQRLDEERKAKERARQQLDQRMDELQKRKSKFACL